MGGVGVMALFALMVCLVPADVLHPAPCAKSATQARTRSAVLLLRGGYSGVPIKPLLCLRGGAADDSAEASGADDGGGGGDSAGGEAVEERAGTLLRLASCRKNIPCALAFVRWLWLFAQGMFCGCRVHSAVGGLIFWGGSHGIGRRSMLDPKLHLMLYLMLGFLLSNKLNNLLKAHMLGFLLSNKLNNLPKAQGA